MENKYYPPEFEKKNLTVHSVAFMFIKDGIMLIKIHSTNSKMLGYLTVIDVETSYIG
jgi:hypothetical protein